MPDRSTPPAIEDLGDRPFAFYPPIVGLDHNEWRFRKASWSEVLVANTKSGEEIWVPRRFLGEVSKIGEPVVVVGLNRELQFRLGVVVPYERRVIEIPRAVNEGPRPAAPPPEPKPAPVVGIRLEGQAEDRVGRFVLSAIALGIVLCIVAVVFFRTAGNRVLYSTVVQSDLPLTYNDDYYSVIQKLGPPASERWRAGQGELQYRLLAYPDRGISVLLMGSERDKALYVGAVDARWRIVHSIAMPNGQNSAQMLRNVKPF